MKNKWLVILAAVIWFLVTVYLMTIPGNSLPKSPFFELIHVDKWVHIGMFSILVFLFMQGTRLFYKQQQPKAMLAIAVAGVLYGIAMEFVQKYWTVGRSFDITDIIADAVGCIIAYIYVRYLIKRKQLREQTTAAEAA
ncbi:VanZ family protein [Deminuibacter soli]|uniref:VanZ family protein n=1 Tax=Deminuibacter soli TaxID=2291815 RepID=A0A3E1NPY4_9BACT|nr:VanZ family protein [Deminuibacter soli]RFM29884.1 VanZ family protein [Deminuibacter soli]